MKRLVDSINAFTLDLFREVKGEAGNIFLSPWNIANAIALVFAGARGETERQISRALNTTPEQEGFHKAFGALISDLKARRSEQGYQLSIASGVWLSEKLKILDDYSATIKDTYDAELAKIDFINANAAAQAINSWVAKQTNGKIRDLIDQLDPVTKMVLVSAIYFKGDWQDQFLKTMTRDERFHLASGQAVLAPMMHQTRSFPYLEEEDFQALEMPYAGKRLSMVILLPKSVDKLSALENTVLDPDRFDSWLSQLSRQKVRVFLPRFTYTFKLKLNSILSALGMENAFSAKLADFSGITGGRDLFITAAIHQAYVDVNEEGTEAAAATAFVMAPTGLPPPIPIFKADRPFLFLIRDSKTGSILFIGKVMNPLE